MLPTTTPSIRVAPRDQCRVLALDRDTGEETVEFDCWTDADAYEYVDDHADERPWITLCIYDDQGRAVDGR